VNVEGKKRVIEQKLLMAESQTFFLQKKSVPGIYFIVIRNIETGEVVYSQKVFISR
jgi:hypothetical protein